MANTDKSSSPFGFPQDEIYLVRLFSVFAGHWKVISGATALVVALVAGGGLSIPKKYEAKGVIEIGSWTVEQKEGFLESEGQTQDRIASLAKKIESDINRANPGSEFPIANDLIVRGDKFGIVEVLLRTAHPKPRGIIFLNTLFRELIQVHHRIYQIEKGKIENRQILLEESLISKIELQKGIKRELALIEKQIQFERAEKQKLLLRWNELSGTISRSKNRNTGDSSWMFLSMSLIRELESRIRATEIQARYALPARREGKLRHLTRIETEKRRVAMDKLDQALALTGLTETAVIFGPEFSKNPVSPNLKVLLAIAVLAGVFCFSIMIVFLFYWEKFREQGMIRGKE